MHSDKSEIMLDQLEFKLEQEYRARFHQTAPWPWGIPQSSRIALLRRAIRTDNRVLGAHKTKRQWTDC